MVFNHVYIGSILFFLPLVCINQLTTHPPKHKHKGHSHIIVEIREVYEVPLGLLRTLVHE